MASFINKNIPDDAVIETWERELSILTTNRFYYPDQVMLVQAHLNNYRGGNAVYSLGEEYFTATKPSYLVVGWFARFTKIYDLDYITKQSVFIASFGDGDWRYDVYKMNLP